MKLSRRYQILPDRAMCVESGCAWHREGEDAEKTGAAHSHNTGHEVVVHSGALVFFNHPATVTR